VLIATSNLCSTSSVSADAYTYEYNGNQPPAANGSQLEIFKVAIDNTTGSDITNAIVGVPFKYKITVVNNSRNAAATNVVISDLVPASLSITNNDGGTQTGNSITWNVGSLTKIGAGQNTVQKIITVVPSCSSLLSVSNTANVISSPPDNGQGIGAATVITNITDNIPPTANCKPITVYLNSAGVATITESMINDGSTDNCSIQSMTISKYSFNCANIGANTVTLTVTDVSGNSATCTSSVTVVDNLAPVFTSCPPNPAPSCADNATSYTKVGTSWDALATDNCTFSLVYTLSGSTTGTGTSLNGVAFNVGTTTVTWKATDSAGNVSNCIFTVTIIGLPVIITQPLSQLDCEGRKVDFEVIATGTGLTYSWQYKKPLDSSYTTIIASTSNVDDFDTSNIGINNVGSAQFPNGTLFQVIVSNSSGCSVTSSAATLSVNEITGISPTATNVTQCYGTNYSYTVSTSTPPPGSVVSYQWKTNASGSWNNVVDGTHFFGSNTDTLNILNGTPAQSAEYKVQVIFATLASTCTVTTTVTRRITFLPEVTPPIATITQPDCITPTGSVVLSGLPVSGTWTLARSGTSSATTTGTGTSTLITGLTPGTYTYTVTLGTCTSVASADIVIQAATTAIWNGSSWTNGPPTVNQALEFTGNYSSTGDLTACSCTVASGQVVFNPNHSLLITNWVHVNGGSLTFEDSSSLVQINNVANTGNITYKRNTTRITRMDYTYWSTPVMPYTLGSVSPNTSGDKFYSYSSSGQDWQQESAATAMVPGVGYIIRGPQNFTINNPAFYEAPFVGVPNNGPYSISGIIADRSYLLGNPYPSALDADAFLDTNQYVLDGTLYFWTHNTPIAVGTPDPGTGLYAYSGNDYASYNRTGGVSTAAQAPSSLPPLTGINDNIPSGKIASGQGFFGGSKVTLPSSPMIVYDNTMRVGVGMITGNNSQFYKTKNPKAKIYVLEKHRIWLDLTNTQGAFKQTLVGYVSDATNDYEGRFDGESFDGNDFLDFYSILPDRNLTIQGRALPFDQNDEIPLGYRVAVAGTFSVAIGQVDGLLLNQPVFIEDKLKNTIHNLKGGKYTFATEAGTFDDRFVLRYTDKTLGIDEVEVNDGIIALYSNNYKTLIIRNTLQDATVNSVTLFSLSGQKIAIWDVKGREQTSIQIPIKNLPAEIYVVKIKTTQGDFSKKIIVK
jgi:large repetitive protein